MCQDYLARPPRRPSAWLAASSDVKLMVTLRDPAERAFSSYLHMLRSGWRAGTFLDALSSYPELLDHGRYGTQLERVPSAGSAGTPSTSPSLTTCKPTPRRFLGAVTEWLGIEPFPPDSSLREPRLPAGTARSVVVSRIVSWGAHVLREHDGGKLVGRVKRLPLVQRTLYKPLADDRPRMTTQERFAVQAALAEEVHMLEKYDLDLTLRWGWPV